MKLRGLFLTAVVGLLQGLVPLGASADAPEPPAGPLFNQVQLKVLADNDFAVFMGNDLGVTRIFYQNNVSWPDQVANIQTLDLYPASGETFVYILPMGGNGNYYPDDPSAPGYPEGQDAGGEEDWSGVLNNIPLLDYPGGEVAVGRRVADPKDLFHTGHLLLNNHISNFTTSAGAIAGGHFSVKIEDLLPASQNLIWSPATRNDHPLIPNPKPSCSVSCAGNRFTPAIPNGAWNIPDGSAALFRYPLSNANLPVSPGDRQVTVTWKDPVAGGAVDNYLIEYKESSQPDSAFKTFGTVAGTVRSSTVTGLTNGIAYTLRVTANNVSGSSSSLGRSVVPTGTPSRPSNQSYSAGDGSVEINFSPPENDGGMAVTNYSYSIDDGATWITRAPASTDSPIRIPGLTNGQTYSIRLRAINPFGAGPASLPIVVTAGIVETRTLSYVSGTLAEVTGMPTGRVFNEGDSFTVAAGPVRPNFTFLGWKDGNVSYNPGDTYVIGKGNPTLTAQWIQDSLLGTSAASKSRVLTWNIIAGQAIDTAVSAGASNSVRIQIPEDALDPGTEVVFWRLFDDGLAKAKISDENSYFVNLAVTWSIGDDVTTPKMVQLASKPIVLTIVNSSIVTGATAWQIIGDSVKVIGRAEIDGELVLRFTEDPVITAANVSPIPLFSNPVSTVDGFTVDLTNYDELYGWDEPTVSAGVVTVTSTSGKVKSLKVTGLSQGQSATITQRSFLNGVFQTGTVTGTATAIVQTPPPQPEPIFEIQTPVVEEEADPEVTISPEATISPEVTSPVPTANTPKNKSFAIAGFRPGSSMLTASMKRSMDKFLKTAALPKEISCTGYTMGPTVLRGDQVLAERRAKAVCDYLASKKLAVNGTKAKGITTKNLSPKYRRAVIALSY